MHHTRKTRTRTQKKTRKHRLRGGQVTPMTIDIARAILKKRSDLKEMCERSPPQSKLGGLQKSCPAGCRYTNKRCVADYRTLTAKVDPEYEVEEVDQISSSEGMLVKKLKKESQLLDHELQAMIDRSI